MVQKQTHEARTAHIENLEEVIKKIIDAAAAPKKRKLSRQDQFLIAKYQLMNYLHQRGRIDPHMEKTIEVYGRTLAVEARYKDPITNHITVVSIFPHARTVPAVRDVYSDQKARIPKDALRRDGIGYHNEYRYLIYADVSHYPEAKLIPIGPNPLGPHPNKKQKFPVSLVRKKD